MCLSIFRLDELWIGFFFKLNSIRLWFQLLSKDDHKNQSILDGEQRKKINLRKKLSRPKLLHRVVFQHGTDGDTLFSIFYCLHKFKKKCASIRL